MGIRIGGGSCPRRNGRRPGERKSIGPAHPPPSPVHTGCIRNIRTLCFLLFLLSLSMMELHEFKCWINTNFRPSCASSVCHWSLTLARSVSRGHIIEQSVSVSEHQEGMAKNYSTSFREKAVGRRMEGRGPRWSAGNIMPTMQDVETRWSQHQPKPALSLVKKRNWVRGLSVSPVVVARTRSIRW